MMNRKIMEFVLNTMTFLSVVMVCIIVYAAYEDYNRKQVFDQNCLDSGGIPLKYTYHYDRKQNRIEYTCLSVNAIIDVE